MEVKCAKKKGRGGETNGGLFIKKISTQTCGGSFVSLYNWTVGGMEVMTNTQEIVPNRTFVALRYRRCELIRFASPTVTGRRPIEGRAFVITNTRQTIV